MTEPYRPLRCSVCGWTSAHAPGCPNGTPTPSGEIRELLAAYVDLRRDCIAIEELMARTTELSPDDLKRLDKAVTVMKVGFKVVKKVLRANGVASLNSWRDTPQEKVKEPTR